MQVKSYDAIVVGSGCGLLIVEEALAHGLKMALVDRGPLGGTCPNLGCIPSKMLIYPADIIVEIEEASKLGVAAKVTNIDFEFVMELMGSFGPIACLTTHGRNILTRGMAK
jgi:mycothione reductase